MNKLKIKDIVYSVSETHPFNFEKLYAINTSDVFQGKIINKYHNDIYRRA